jgi:hypothetical protein
VLKAALVMLVLLVQTHKEFQAFLNNPVSSHHNLRSNCCIKGKHLMKATPSFKQQENSSSMASIIISAKFAANFFLDNAITDGPFLCPIATLHASVVSLN